MAKWTLYGIPRSAWNGFKRIVSGPLLDVVWKVSVLVVALAIGVALLTLGGPGWAAVGGILIGVIVSDDVRKLLSDVYHRRWAELSW